MKQTYKILLVSTGGHIGGEETFTRNLALALLKRGHQIWVAPGGDIQKKDLEKNQIPVADLPVAGRSPFGLLKGAKAISRFAETEGVDIVHCQAAGPAILGALTRWLHLPATKCVWIWHDHGISARTYHWIPRFLNKLDQSIANSDYELIKLLGEGVRDDKIRRIHNGVDPQLWMLPQEQIASYRVEIRKQYAIPEDAPVWGYVGRLSPEKGCDLFVPSAVRILKDNPSARFMITGDGVMKDQLQQAFAQAGIQDKVCFCGFQTEMPKYMSALDVLILPSKMETFSLTVLQSMAMGLPVVGTDVGGTPEQIAHGYDGLLFLNGDEAGLAESVNRLLSDKAYCQELGRTGQMIIRGYLNIDRMIDQIEETYTFFMKDK